MAEAKPKGRVKTSQERRLELVVETRNAELEEARAAEKEWRDEANKIKGINKVLEVNSANDKKRNEELLVENHKLRGLIHSGELAYAKLAGYVERIRDEQPPEMVPQRRESLLATLPDGTQGFDYTPRTDSYSMYDHGRERPKRWFER